MKKDLSTTDIMLSGFHIDRGINCTAELEMILQNLKKNPAEFNQMTAEKLIRVAQIARNCFYDCYEKSAYKNFAYEATNDQPPFQG